MNSVRMAVIAASVSLGGGCSNVWQIFSAPPAHSISSAANSASGNTAPFPSSNSSSAVSFQPGADSNLQRTAEIEHAAQRRCVQAECSQACGAPRADDQTFDARARAPSNARMLARLKLSTAVNPASASARNIACPISPRPNTAIGVVARHAGQPLHDQCLHATRAALRKNAARAVQQIADAAPCDVQAAAYRAVLVRALERAQNLIADGVLALGDGVEPRRHAQQATHRGGAMPHAGPYTIGIFRGADQRRAEQLRGPRRPRGGQQPLDARAAFDAHDAGDLFGRRAIAARGPLASESKAASAARTADGASR